MNPLRLRILSSPPSGKKREPKPRLFSLGLSSVGAGVFHVKGVGAKKFGMSFEAQGNQTFGRDIPGFLPGYPGGASKFERKKFVFNSRPLILSPDLVLFLYPSPSSMALIEQSTVKHLAGCTEPP